jgi:hypothetical protein
MTVIRMNLPLLSLLALVVSACDFASSIADTRDELPCDSLDGDCLYPPTKMVSMRQQRRLQSPALDPDMDPLTTLDPDSSIPSPTNGPSATNGYSAPSLILVPSASSDPTATSLPSGRNYFSIYEYECVFNSNRKSSSNGHTVAFRNLLHLPK